MKMATSGCMTHQTNSAVWKYILFFIAGPCALKNFKSFKHSIEIAIFYDK
jgi:hypothetical protein